MKSSMHIEEKERRIERVEWFGTKKWKNWNRIDLQRLHG